MALRGKLRLTVRLITYLTVTLLFLPFITVCEGLNLITLKKKLICFYYRLSALSWGIYLSKRGQFAKDRPLLVVSNHCSYTDIPVLGAFAPVHFTPKADIASWPVIGYLCKLSDCVFINRNPRKTAENMNELNRAIQKGWMISLFPEGTTNDGHCLQPFRSSYFSLAEQGLPVQMVTILYTQPNGEPLSKEAMRKIAWIDDDEFSSHLMEFLSQPAIRATVICHEVTSIEKFENRKALAAHCEQVISDGLSEKRALQKRSAL